MVDAISISITRTMLLNREEVIAGYQATARLYPHVPPLVLWRGWEYAAYKHFALTEPVLDVGCGDGRYFRFVWPAIRDVSGIDMDSGVAKVARQSGIYRDVYVAQAHTFQSSTSLFRSAFANCSLEHMDRLDEVIAGVYQSLQPGGDFLLSVVTDKWLEWESLPLLVEKAGEPERARLLLNDYIDYHHCVNPLAHETWVQSLQQAGFEVLEHIPIVPEMTARFFLFLDHLWHLRYGSGEIGDALDRFCSARPQLSSGLIEILAGLLTIELDWSTGCGAVLHARRK